MPGDAERNLNARREVSLADGFVQVEVSGVMASMA
jgi:hypothetical protein